MRDPVRVATYSQPATATRGSLFAMLVLVLAVLLGTSALHSLVLHFAPHLGVVTSSLLWLLLYLMGFLGLMFSQGINWISWMVRYRILLVVLLVGTVVSIGWSVAPGVSAERVVYLFGGSVVAIYLGFMVPLLTILRISAGVLGAIMVMSVAAALLLPDLGIENYEGQLVWKGILNDKNTLGFWSAISVLLFITISDSVRTFLARLFCYTLALISMFVLIMSDSATSLLAMVVAGSLSLYLYLAFRFQLGFVRMAVMAVLFVGLIGLIISNIDTAQLLGRSGDLTGRGEVWAQTWKLIVKEPLTGYGYGALWWPNDDTIWIQQRYTDFTWVVYHAHNGFLQVASEIGLPLSVIALLMVIQQLIEIFYCQYERQQAGVLFVLAFVVAFLISNFSEARFLTNRELYWIFFLALPISMLRQITLVSTNPDEWDDSDVPDESVRRPRPFTDDDDESEFESEYAPSAMHRSLGVDADIDPMDEYSQMDETEFDGGFDHVSIDDETDIDLGEHISADDDDDDDDYYSRDEQHQDREDPHDQMIEPEAADPNGVDDFEDFDDDQYDRFDEESR